MNADFDRTPNVLSLIALELREKSVRNGRTLQIQFRYVENREERLSCERTLPHGIYSVLK